MRVGEEIYRGARRVGRQRTVLVTSDRGGLIGEPQAVPMPEGKALAGAWPGTPLAPHFRAILRNFPPRLPQAKRPLADRTGPMRQASGRCGQSATIGYFTVTWEK